MSTQLDLDDAAAPHPLAVAELQALRTALRQAVLGYYAALDKREHGGMAQDRAFPAIEQALGMHWVQGASTRHEPPNVEVRGRERPGKNDE